MDEQLNPWTVESGLKYWYKHKESHYINQIAKKYNKFDVMRIIKKHYGKDKIHTVVDIAGGKYGGFLYFFKEGKERYLVDILAGYFSGVDDKLNKLPDDVTPIVCDFTGMPFKESVDIMFSQESIDHCVSEDHYYESIDKIVDALSPGGLLFHEWMVRKGQIEGHLIVRDCTEVIKDFGKLSVIQNQRVKKRCYLVFKKEEK